MPQNGGPRSPKRSKTADADVAAYLNSCRAYNVTPDPATSTTLATGWWDLGVPSCGGAFTSFKRLVSISQ